MRLALVRPLTRPALARRPLVAARTFKKKAADPADKPVVAPDGQKFEADAFAMGNSKSGPKGANDGSYTAGRIANEEGDFANQRNTPDVNAQAAQADREALKKEVSRVRQR